jgi:hypothetical protein
MRAIWRWAHESVSGAGRSRNNNRLVLWCEYGADPTWRFVRRGPRVMNVSLASLGLSQSTKAALRSWARSWEDEIWLFDDQGEEIEPYQDVVDAFLREGERLRGVVQDELGPSVDVVLDYSTEEEVRVPICRSALGGPSDDCGHGLAVEPGDLGQLAE